MKPIMVRTTSGDMMAHEAYHRLRCTNGSWFLFAFQVLKLEHGYFAKSSALMVEGAKKAAVALDKAKGSDRSLGVVEEKTQARPQQTTS